MRELIFIKNQVVLYREWVGLKSVSDGPSARNNQVERTEIETLWKMQVAAFSGLLEKYRDYDTSPAAEGIEKAGRAR